MAEGEATPVVEAKRLVERDDEGMSQSYHEIFDTQGYRGSESSPCTISSPQEGSTGSEVSGDTETGTLLDVAASGGQVFFNEGSGRLECEDGGDPGTTTKYLTSKLVADSLMWQQTFRNDSPSPEEWPGHSPEEVPGARPRPSSLVNEGQGEIVIAPSVPGAPDPKVLEDLEREARRLATEVDSLVENLSCTLQSVSALTVDTVETYRDGVCKTCDEVDNNIKAMYQLMAKWEELNKNMAPAYRVATQIKDIKRLLEMFEAALG